MCRCEKLKRNLKMVAKELAATQEELHAARLLLDDPDDKGLGVLKWGAYSYRKEVLERRWWNPRNNPSIKRETCWDEYRKFGTQEEKGL
jgi:hypothetical protein